MNREDGQKIGGNIWITNFYVFAFQMPIKFIFQVMAWIHKLKFVIWATSHGPNNILFVSLSRHDLNKEPFNERTGLNHSNTELVCSSDPHCTPNFYVQHQEVQHGCNNLSKTNNFQRQQFHGYVDVQHNVVGRTELGWDKNRGVLSTQHVRYSNGQK